MWVGEEIPEEGIDETLSSDGGGVVIRHAESFGVALHSGRWCVEVLLLTLPVLVLFTARNVRYKSFVVGQKVQKTHGDEDIENESRAEEGLGKFVFGVNLKQNKFPW